MDRRKAIKLVLLGSAAVTSLVSCKWLGRLKSADLAYLSDKKSLIAELAETIIPATDTPGAKAAQVEDFILRMLMECTDPRSLNNFIFGLQELEAFSLLHYKRSFTFCSPAQKEVILKEFEDKTFFCKGILGKIEKKILGKPFFVVLRNYTVEGFCTSRLGATQVLNYEFIPGRYENIGPVSPQQRSWATK